MLTNTDHQNPFILFIKRRRETVELLQRPRAGELPFSALAGLDLLRGFWLLLARVSWMSVVRWCILMWFQRSDPFYAPFRQTLVQKLKQLQFSLLHGETLCGGGHETERDDVVR